MWFRLAALWGCSPREAMARCDSAEFTELCAFYTLSPFGPERGDMQAAVIASTVANANPMDRKQYKLSDFMLRFGKSNKLPSPKELQQKVSNIFGALVRGGK